MNSAHSTRASTISSSGTTATLRPFTKRWPRLLPAAIPRSASRASPGPFTTQPITAICKGSFLSSNAFIALLATSITSTSALPQLGHAMRSTFLRSRNPSASSNWRPARASSTGSAVRLYRMVSPIPSKRSVAIPAVAFTKPAGGGPASVTPKCKGMSVASASILYASTMRGTLLAFTEILMRLKSTSWKYAISCMADSTIAAAVSPPYLSYNAGSSDPPFTPIRMGKFLSRASDATALMCSGLRMLPGFKRKP